MSEPAHIVVIEDDETLSLAISEFLSRQGFQVSNFSSATLALEKIDASVDLILSDVMMPGMSGYDLLQSVKQKYPQISIILMTAYGTIEKAVSAMKYGAYDFLVKPFSLTVLETSLKAALLDLQELKPRLHSARIEPKHTVVGLQSAPLEFIASDPKMLEIIKTTRLVAGSKATILIQGESGTGKELIAKMIHEFSPRKNRIFVAINCAAIPDALLESELFGHERGAFTDAVTRQIGKFELSDNGTILLDEISEMSLNMQTKLLRVLQESEIYRLGSVKPIPLNLRVIATTNRDLLAHIQAGHFREDLYYRLNVIPITPPPLRLRGDDIILLAREFIGKFAILHGREPLPFVPEAIEKISGYAWPGNVRELKNTMERAILVGSFSVMDEIQLSGDNSALTYIERGMTLDQVQHDLIIKTLERFHGNRTKTAQQLGISLRTLRNKLSSYRKSGESIPDSE